MNNNIKYNIGIAHAGGQVVIIDGNYNTVQIINEHRPVVTVIPMQLPMPVQYFVGRQEEVNDLSVQLKPGKLRSIIAIGGMGKTSLAIKVLHQITNNGTKLARNFPDGIIFHSFYNNPSNEAAYNHIARSFNVDPYIDAKKSAKQALEGKHCLLILDGAEDSEDLTGIKQIISGACGVLITSRSPKDAVLATDELLPLTEDQSLDLLEAKAGDKAEDKVLSKLLCAYLENLPLAIDIAGSYMHSYGVYVADYYQELQNDLALLEVKEKHKQDSLLLLLQRSIGKLGPKERDLLAIIGLLAIKPIPKQVLNGIASLQEMLFLIRQLHSVGLMNSTPSGYQIKHPLVHQYSRQNLTPKRKQQTALVEFYIPFIKKYSTNTEGFTQIHLHHEHILSLINRMYSKEEYSAVIQLVRVIAGGIEEHRTYLDLQGYSSEREEILKLGLLSAKYVDDISSEGAFTDFLGLTYRHMGKIERSIRYHKNSLVIHKSMDNNKKQAANLSNLGVSYALLEDWDSVINYFNQSLQINREIGDKSGEGITLNNIGNVHRNKNESSLAISYYKDALVIAKDINNGQLQSLILGNIGNVNYEKGEYNKAKHYYHQSLEITERLGDIDTSANQLYNLGLTYKEQSNITKALEYLKKASDIYERIGNLFAVDKTQKELKECLSNLNS